jgi:predicted methyltransferase
MDMNHLKHAFLPLITVLLITASAQALAKHHGKMGAPLAEALSNETRAEADRMRDPGRKPAQVLAFLGIGPGMTVMDMIAAGGYYTEVLSLAVGSEGKVYAQNPPGVLQFRDGANEKAISQRLAGDRLANVTRINADLHEAGLAAGSLDAVITALNFHDIYNGSGKDAAVGAARTVHSLLKPGGVFGVIDHAGTAEGDNATMHRIDIELVKAALTEAGFEIDATSDLLANPDDTHDKGVFDPSIRGKTDRFLIRATKAE